MSSDVEMRRLILHSADVLAAQDPLKEIKATLAADYHTERRRLELANEIARISAAMALAEGTLRMVAACMAVDTREAPERDERGRFVPSKAPTP